MRIAPLTIILCLAALAVPTRALPPQAGFPVAAEFFAVNDRPAFLALSDKAPAGKPRPWVLFAPSLPNSPNHHEEWLLRQLLDAGISIAGIDVGESHGNPAGRAHYSALYRELTERRGMAPKAVLLGRSRGGLMTLCWAAENPEKVAAFAGIFPVFDLASWPGLAKAAPAYGMTPAELERNLAAHNPIDRLAPLAAAKIPLFAIHGDADTLVPLKANSALVKSRYARRRNGTDRSSRPRAHALGGLFPLPRIGRVRGEARPPVTWLFRR